MTELLHIGVDGIRASDGKFDTGKRYLRQVASSPLSRLVRGPSIKLAFGAGQFAGTNIVCWTYKVGAKQSVDYAGIGFPSNTVTEFDL